MDINGRYYQQFIYDDLPDIINMCDMREVKQLNEKIMKICKLGIDNLEEQEINTNSIESNENKSHETTDSIQLQKQSSQSSNKCVNKNDKSETLLHNNRANYCDRNEINREEKSTENEDKNPKALIRCPICLKQIADKDCIECTRCFM
jgi:hypothetical protein